MKVNIKQAKEAIKSIISEGLRRPIFLWGPPGVGKSSIVKQIALELNMELIDLRLSLLEPSDLRGFPKIEDGVTKWFRPEFIPTEGRGILLLDELNVAAPPVQGAAYQLVLDGKVGQTELGKGWYTIAAGNREGDDAFIYHMPSPLRNRFIHIEVEPDLEAFKSYALEKDFPNEIIAYLNWKPDRLHKMLPDAQAFPTPRSWEYVADIMRLKAPDDVKRTLILGAIGEVGEEFLAFVRLKSKLPNLDDIIRGKVKLPDDPSLMYLISSALVHRIIHYRDDKFSLNELLNSLAKFPGDFQAMMLKEILMSKFKNDNNAVSVLLKHPAFKNFANQFAEIL